MRQFISFLIISLLAFGLVVNEASAKRFGGGRSFGVQRSSSSFSSPFKKPAMNSPGNGLNKSRWGGMLGGLLIGGLLASLFMGNGLANGLLTWLIVGAVVLFCINLYRRKMQPNYQSAQSNTSKQSPINFKEFINLSTPVNSSKSTNEEDIFLRDGKVKFIRLQEAYDKKNLQDLSEFTTPEVFAEIKMQLQERGDAYNQTEVVDLDAQLLEKGSNSASVRFSGLIKEEDNPAEAFEEIWHFSNSSDSQWLVSGIQQK